ncbi:MAG TPA: ABC transporter permease subunit [Actinomycetota bacterium]|jgi:hypothetical protein|nr:ABC transporter permease subunit [Actinomycetota bacterium]
MTWVAWRQHRGQAAAGAAMLLGYCLLALGEHRFRRITGATTSLAVYLPVMIGVFWGAPLLARELESGTHQLAWTQSVTRRRWLAHRLLVAAITGLLLSGALTALLTWGVRSTARPGPGRFTYFDMHGLVPLAATLFGLALGTAVGGVLRRTIWSMGASLAVLILSRPGLEAIRPWYETPLRATPAHRPGPLDWVVANDAGGLLYQPASRFWAFQGIESGIYLALALCLLAFAFWWTPRRAG